MAIACNVVNGDETAPMDTLMSMSASRLMLWVGVQAKQCTRLATTRNTSEVPSLAASYAGTPPSAKGENVLVLRIGEMR